MLVCYSIQFFTRAVEAVRKNSIKIKDGMVEYTSGHNDPLTLPAAMLDQL